MPSDEALTGTKDNRPEFQRLIADCRAGRVDIIITKAISRFARNTVTLLKTVRELKAIGVDVFFEEQNIHTLSAEGELMLTILASYAQEESRSTSENIKWRIRKKFEAGEPFGGLSLLGYNIKKGEFTIIPEEAEIVKQIYTDYLSGMGTYAITDKLNSQGVEIGTNGVSGILRNEKYIGDLLLQKSFTVDHLTKKKKDNKGELPQYYVEGHHEPIIDKDIFEQVQAEIGRRWNGYLLNEYPFTGMIRCGTCGDRYRRKITAVNTKYAKPVYICKTFNTLGKAHCGSQQVPEIVLKQQTALVLGTDVFDETELDAQIEKIIVPEANRLIFVFKDGNEVSIEWKTTRRDSWTDEMKQQAREHSLKGHRMRRGEQNE